MPDNKKCNECGQEYEYSKLLECDICQCTKDKLVQTYFMPKLLKEWDK